MDDAKGKDKAKAPTLDEQLQEGNGKAREGKCLVMGSRREGGQLQPVKFLDSQGAADTYAEALTETGWAAVEVYTRTSAHKRA
jgi:hypothetical protein